MWSTINIILFLASICCFMVAFRIKGIGYKNQVSINWVIAGLLICAAATGSTLVYLVY